MGKKLLLLSHIDLDGYASQYFAKKYAVGTLGYSERRLEYVNVNYTSSDSCMGIQEALDIFEEYISDYAGIIITDLNLSLKQCKFISRLISDNNIFVELIDHHQPTENKEPFDITPFPWYRFNKEVCATRSMANTIVSDVLGTELSEAEEALANLVNTYDTWKSTDKSFNLATVLSNFVTRTVMYYPDNKRKYIFSLFDALSNSQILVSANNTGVYSAKEFELFLYDFSRNYACKEDDTVPVEVALQLTDLDSFVLEANDTEYTLGDINFNIVSVPYLLFQTLSHAALEKGLLSYKAIANYNPKTKSLSFRSSGTGLAKKLANCLPGGNGHPDAAGANALQLPDLHNFLVETFE